MGNVSVLKAFYQKMKDYGVDYDIIGLSYYPYYHGTLSTLNTALTQMENSYADKKIMIVEVGYYHDWQPSNVSYDLSSTYPINGEGQKAFTQDLIGILNNHANVNGLFWWFMEANEYGLNWNTQRVTDDWYNAGLKDFNNNDMHVNELDKAKTATEAIYTIDGRLIGTQVKDLPDGIYIVNGKKTILK